MDINVTAEQIEKIAHEEIRNMLRPKVTEVLKDKYWMRQSLHEVIVAAIHSIVKERVDEKLSDEVLLQIIKNQNLIEHLSGTLVKAVTHELVDQLVDHFE